MIQPSGSPQDENDRLFNNFLTRNKSFTIISKSKSKETKLNFPLYFGTTEDEILPHRKLSLIKRRLARQSKENQRIINQNQNQVQNQPDKKSTGTKSNIKQSTSSSTPVMITPLNPSPAPTLASQLSKIPNKEKDKKLEKLEKNESTTESSTSTEITTPSTTSSLSSALKTPTVSKQQPEFNSKPVSTPAPLSFAEQLRAKKPVQSSSSPSSSSSTVSPSASQAVPNGRAKPTSVNQRSTTQSPSNVPSSTFDTVSSEFQSSSMYKPLGITLLRIMFDSQYINKIFKPTNDSTSNKIYPHGLQNSGNICYMNSILQFLFYCDPFSQMLNIIRETTMKDLDDLTNSKTPILSALLDLQESFQISTPLKSDPEKFETINPDKFYSTISKLPRFSHLVWGRQEDAEELLNILLDGLHEEFIESIKSLTNDEINNFAEAFGNKETTKKILQNVDFIKDSSEENASALLESDSWNEVGSNMKPIGKRISQIKLSPIVNLFGGQFRSVLKSNNNKKSSITLDPFMQVQLDISDPGTKDLNSAFEKFSQEEEVSLGSSTMAKKQNFIDKLPSILIIHLKRFSFVANDEFDSENAEYEVVSNNKKNKKGKNIQQQSFTQPQTPTHSKLFDGRIEKIHKFIKYDHELTLPKSCISTMISELPNYKLLGVVYHHGRSTENGHYTVDVNTKSGSNDWIRIDDTNITKISPIDAISDQNVPTNINKTAYILMFQKL